MYCVGARVPNFFHFANYEFELLIARIEMRRDAYAGAGTKIDDELATNQLSGDRSRVFVSNCDCAATIGGVLWTGHDKSCFFSQPNQTRRLPHTLPANSIHANLVDYLITRLRRVERGNCRRAMKKPRDARRVTKFGVESKRRLVGHPAGRFRLELLL